MLMLLCKHEKTLGIFFFIAILLLAASFITYTTKQIKGFCIDLNNCTVTIKGNFWQ